MTIGEISRTTGIPASTIRYYERIGILPAPKRISGKRRYSPEAVDRMSVVKLAQACGFRLEEMRLLISGFHSGGSPSPRWREIATRKKQEIDEQVARLSAMQHVVDRVLRCECADLEECGRITVSVIQAEAQ